ncbi:hypothetical protein EYF80_018629 [Liparis tanakae]|uniref:Uncharacterized protein n=1 Tax=Liparis tanakae TaxID=230148 RepID=A0A4Z2HZ30_9TELE|nr:hypothetical protein EYF80_018629 [Liparis tanakae]
MRHIKQTPGCVSSDVINETHLQRRLQLPDGQNHAKGKVETESTFGETDVDDPVSASNPGDAYGKKNSGRDRNAPTRGPQSIITDDEYRENTCDRASPLELFEANFERSFRHLGLADLLLQDRSVITILIFSLLISVELPARFSPSICLLNKGRAFLNRSSKVRIMEATTSGRVSLGRLSNRRLNLATTGTDIDVPFSSRWLTRCMFRGESTLNLTVEPGRSTPSWVSSSGRRLGIWIPSPGAIIRRVQGPGCCL